ncbi:VanZ family protein [Bacillus sp. BGMRC 2118]|nr:VanZ family protein [Bacillus sp. BGMRC 2118]
MKLITKAGLLFILILYVLILTKLVLFKHYAVSEMFRFHFDMYKIKSSNFVPFKTIYLYLVVAKDLNSSIRIINLAGNVVGFVPFGFLLPLLNKDLFALTRMSLATLMLSFTYEIFQLFTYLGSFDVDDLLLNTIGGVIGYSILKLVSIMIASRLKLRKFNEEV